MKKYCNFVLGKMAPSKFFFDKDEAIEQAKKLAEENNSPVFTVEVVAETKRLIIAQTDFL
jgi:hypothetical protein